MSSSIPLAVNNLLVMMDPNQGGALPTGSQVIFRKYMPRYIAPVTLQVSEVHGAQSPAELGPTYRREEEYEIHCCLAYTEGDDNFLNAFNQTMSNFAIVERTIGNNPWLSVASNPGPGNGAVRFAEILNEDFVPDADSKGFVVGEMTFTVRCQQRITSLS